ncbi:hypothetical protein KP509_34G067000 [Ceratopteris richardii]|nr:hypothetical protein KP509_34G067000 [Ceratopteris richardii]
MHFPNLYSWNILLRAFSQAASFEDAKAVFDQMPCRDVISWNSIIGASIQYGFCREALSLFFYMQRDGIQPSDISLITALDACSNLASIEQGSQIHACIVESGRDRDSRVGSAIINMYGKCEDLESAEVVFGKMWNCNLIPWSAMISAYAHNGRGRTALDMFYEMQANGIQPDEIAFLSVLTACANLGDIVEGKQIHDAILTFKLEKHVNIGNALINMYAKCGYFNIAKQIFDQMEEHDVVSWTAFIGALLQAENYKEALAVFNRLECEGIKPNHVTIVYALDACANLKDLENGKHIHDRISKAGLLENVYVCNALINMYGKCGCLKEVREVFSTMSQRSVASWNTLLTFYAQNGLIDEAFYLFEQIPQKNVISWNNLISAMIHTGCVDKAFDCYERMKDEGINPNSSTFVLVVDGCAMMKDLEHGLQIHKDIVCVGNEYSDILCNALANMYVKCGQLEVARFVFDNIPNRNLISWSTMIAAYVQNRQERQALDLFWNMLQHEVIPDELTFTYLLAACASLAILEEGYRIHAFLIRYDLESCISVGNSLLNMYSKCGTMSSLKAVFSKMQYRDLISWTSIITACAQCGDNEAALRLFSEMQSEGIKPDELTYVGVIAACGHSGHIDDVRGYVSALWEEERGLLFKSDHYVCMVDLLGRAGHLEEAEELLNIMPDDRCHLAWLSFLSSCRNHGDLKRGIVAALSCLRLDPTNDTPLPLLRNLLSVSMKQSQQFDFMKLQNLCCKEKIDDLVKQLEIVYDKL